MGDAAQCADIDRDLSLAAATPALLTVAEVAAMFRVSKMTIYRLIDTGQLPALRLGKSFRIPSGPVHALLRAAVVTPPPAPSG